MALSYDLSAIKDRKDLNPGVTQALIFATMAVGIGDITAKGAKEFWERLRAWEWLFGPFINERPLTFEDIEAHIGLHTNVFPKESKAKFQRKLGLSVMEKAARENQKPEPTPSHLRSV